MKNAENKKKVENIRLIEVYEDFTVEPRGIYDIEWRFKRISLNYNGTLYFIEVGYVYYPESIFEHSFKFITSICPKRIAKLILNNKFNNTDIEKCGYTYRVPFISVLKEIPPLGGLKILFYKEAPTFDQLFQKVSKRFSYLASLFCQEA